MSAAAPTHPLFGAFELALDAVRVLAALPRVERWLARLGPRPLLERARALGRNAPRRAEAARGALRRAIAWVDARAPGHAGCYRRALLEVALDRGAAAEPFELGLAPGGGARSGHAWLGAADASDLEELTVRLTLPP